MHYIILTCPFLGKDSVADEALPYFARFLSIASTYRTMNSLFARVLRHHITPSINFYSVFLRLPWQLTTKVSIQVIVPITHKPARLDPYLNFTTHFTQFNCNTFFMRRCRYSKYREVPPLLHTFHRVMSELLNTIDDLQVCKSSGHREVPPNCHPLQCTVVIPVHGTHLQTTKTRTDYNND